jgi:hypothetical protein
MVQANVIQKPDHLTLGHYWTIREPDKSSSRMVTVLGCHFSKEKLC